MDRHIKPIIRVGVKLALTVLTVAILFVIVGWGDVTDALLAAAMPWLMAMFALKLLRQIIDASQLRFLLGRIGADVGLGRLFLASQLGTFYSLMVPGEIAAAGAKWANLAAATGKRSLVLNAMMYTKLLFVLAPVLIGSVALAYDNPLDSTWILVAPIIAAAGILTMMISLYHPRLGEGSDRLLRRLGSSLPSWLETKLGFLLESMARIRRLRGRDHVVMALLMFAGVGIGISQFYTGMRALGIEVPIMGILWIFAFLAIGRLMPFTIANLGIREGLLVLALSAFSVPAEQAVALGLLSFSTIVLLGIIGAGYQVTLVAGWTRQ